MGQLIWKWRDENEDGEGVGPWWVDDGDESERWVPRSQAEQIASDGGHTLLADE